MSPLPHGKGTSIFQNGDLILSEMGTKRGFWQQKKGTKKCVYLINWLKRANSLKEGKHFLWQILTWILFKMYFQPVLTSNFWKAEGRLELEPASAFSDKREDPKISALRLKLEPLDARRQNWPSSLHNKLWMEPSCKAKRHMKLALPYLTRLLNGESSW